MRENGKPVPNEEEYEELHEEGMPKDRAARIAQRREAGRQTGKPPEQVLEEDDVEDVDPDR